MYIIRWIFKLKNEYFLWYCQLVDSEFGLKLINAWEVVFHLSLKSHVTITCSIHMLIIMSVMSLFRYCLWHFSMTLVILLTNLILPMPFDLSRHLWRQNVKRKGRCTSQWGSMRLRFREDWIRKDILMLHLSNEITIVILILWCRISDFVFLTLNLFAYHGFHSLLCCQVFLHK